MAENVARDGDRDMAIKMLGSPYVNVRAKGVRALEEFSDRETVMALLKALDRETDPNIKSEIGHILIDKGKNAVPYLTEALKSDSERIKTLAIQFLDAVGDERAIEPLIDVILDSQGEPKRKASYALRRIAKEFIKYIKNMEAAEALVEETANKKRTFLLTPLKKALKSPVLQREPAIVEVLTYMGEDMTAPFMDMYRNADISTQMEIKSILRGLDRERVIEFIRPAVRDDNPIVHACAVEILRDISGEHDIEALLRKIDELPTTSDLEVALSSMLAENRLDEMREREITIDELKSTKNVPFLVDALKNRNPKIREMAADILGQTGDPRALDPLVSLLRDPNDDVQISAVKAISRFGIPKVVSILMQNINHPNHNVRAIAIAEVTKKVRENYMRAVEEGNRARRDVASKMMNKLIGDLINLMRSDLDNLDEDVRLDALEMVVAVGRGEDIEPLLLKTMHDPNEKVRAAVVQVLGMVGNVQAVSALIKALYDPDKRVRANAIEALDQMKASHTAGMIEPYLNDPDNRVRANAAKAMHNFGSPKGMETLEKMLREDDFYMRMSAAWALGEIGTPQAQRLLADAARGEKIEHVKNFMFNSINKIRRRSTA
ncbi:MAG: HEAT repeat domain-containing protein [bacterium]